MQPDMTPDGIVDLLRRNDWRVELATVEADSTARLQEAYGRIRPRIEAQANQLVQAIFNSDGQPTPSQLRQLQDYTDFLAVVDAEMSDFSRVVQDVASNAADSGIVAGLNGADRMVGLQSGGQLPSIWSRPSVASVRNVVNYVNSPAFRASIGQFADNAVLNITDLLISGVAQGRNPRQIAQMISDWTDVPYSWAENMARTSMIYSARGATHEAYRQNPRVVEYWMWSSAKDRRTCMSCWSLDGMIFDTTYTLNDHHQGRCTALPIVRGRNWWRDYPLGRDRFEQLPASEQRAIMNNSSLFAAWQSGEVGWDDFSQTYENDIYGTMRRQASLVSIRRQR